MWKYLYPVYQETFQTSAVQSPLFRLWLELLYMKGFMSSFHDLSFKTAALFISVSEIFVLLVHILQTLFHV